MKKALRLDLLVEFNEDDFPNVESESPLELIYDCLWEFATGIEIIREEYLD